MHYMPKSVRDILRQAERYDRYFSNGHKKQIFLLIHSVDSHARTIQCTRTE